MTRVQAEQWRVWQWVDSAFPTGSFAHSAGLEAAWQAGEVASLDDLQAFLQTSLLQAFTAAAPFVAAGHDAPEHVWELDARCDAFLSNAIANRASRRQGQSLLAASVAILGCAGLSELRQEAMAGGRAAHLAPLYGTVARLAGFPRPVVISAFLFTSLRTVVSAAVRLGMVGPMQAQAMQRDLAVEAEAMAETVPELQPEAAAQSAPLLELYQGVHDRLYSRLFQS